MGRPKCTCNDDGANYNMVTKLCEAAPEFSLHDIDGIPDDNEDGDADTDGIPDRSDDEDETGGISEDMRRALLCPRIKKTLHCGKTSFKL